MSAAFKAALFKEDTEEDLVGLVTVEHPELDEPIRAASHALHCLAIDPTEEYGVVSRGQTYDFVGFGLILPEDADRTPPAIELTLPWITQETVALLRSSAEPALVTVEFVSQERPDLVEFALPDFDLITSDYDYAQMSAMLSLGIDTLADEAYPSDEYTPGSAPGLF